MLDELFVEIFGGGFVDMISDKFSRKNIIIGFVILIIIIFGVIVYIK